MELKPGYKRTEVGVIPEEWDVRLLGSLCEKITTGKLDANAMTSNGDYPFFTCAKEHYWINKYAFDAEALLVSGNGANVGYIHHYHGKFNAYQRTYVLTGFSSDIHYTKLFMEKNLQERLRTEVNAGNTPYIVMDTLAKMNVALPSNTNEQRAIAAALLDVDALLAKLDQLITKKRDLKQAAMQQLLTGKRRLPGFSGGWGERPLGEIASATKGTQLHSSESSENGLFAHLNGGISPSGYTEKANTLGGTIAISEGGNSCGYVQFMAEPFWCGGHCYSIIPRGIDNGFLYHALKLQQATIMALRVGSGLPNVQKTALLAFNLTVPTAANEQAAIASVLSDMDAEITTLEARRDKTRALKQGMMQELLTGRIRLV